MKYDFDKEIDRDGTQSVKWSMVQDPDDPSQWRATTDCFGENRLLPMWVADMDFPAPAPVVDALTHRAGHGIFGYSRRTDAYDQAIVGWMKRHHGWDMDPQWIVCTPGVVPALHLLVRSLVRPGERVLIQRPVYYPFFSAIEKNGGEIVSNSLIQDDGRYGIDFADFETKAADPATTLFILCSPHNPVGRVWTPSELERMGEICLKYDVRVIADEIHGDLVYRGVRFTPFAAIGKQVAANTVVCTAPSKTFNLAGLHTANIIIPDPTLRHRFKQTLEQCGMGRWANPFGVLACETAYREGDDWLVQVMAYIEGNLDFLMRFIHDHISRIRIVRPEGTYLVWLDCRSLGLSPRALRRLMTRRANIFLDDGLLFGPEGDGFQRINIACPRSILQEALTRLAQAVDGLAD